MGVYRLKNSRDANPKPSELKTELEDSSLIFLFIYFDDDSTVSARFVIF